MTQLYIGLRILLYGVAATFAVMAGLALLLKIIGRLIEGEKPELSREQGEHGLEEIAAVTAAIFAVDSKPRPERVKIKTGPELPAWVIVEMGDRGCREGLRLR